VISNHAYTSTEKGQLVDANQAPLVIGEKPGDCHHPQKAHSL